MKHLKYATLYALYQVPLFLMAFVVRWSRDVWGERMALELTALGLFIVGFYGSIYWYCMKVEECWDET